MPPKDAFVDRINFAIPAPESLLMGGLILGEKSSFDKALRQSFVNTGTIHIVALSGYNVSNRGRMFMKLFAFLPRLVGIGAGVFAIALLHRHDGRELDGYPGRHHGNACSRRPSQPAAPMTSAGRSSLPECS
ncbi:MAG: ComEC/Rec2 family competence protein [bacterium]